MSAPRFFVVDRCVPGAEIALGPDDSHHAAAVLRMQVGDSVVVVDGVAPWDAEIAAIDGRSVRVRIVGEDFESPGDLPAAITVLQAIPKGAKFDEVVEKVIELGASGIVPVRADRCEADASSAKVARWRRIARAAAAQSRRRMLPRVEEPLHWRDAVPKYAPAMPLIVAWERAPRDSLVHAVTRCLGVSRIAVAIGPEGSFSDDEIEIARAAGCTFVSLGPTILRTQTAATVLIAALAARCGWW